MWFAVVGCGSRHTFEFDELDLSPAHDELIEFSLGRYEIPIPIADVRADGRTERTNRLKFDFELYVLVAPQQMSQVADAWDRHQGKIRDRIMRVCRNATMEELHEPELATLKSHLMDAVQTQLGERSIRQMLITEVVSQEM